MRRRYMTLTIAGVLIIVSLLSACGSDTEPRSTPSPSATASSPAGLSQPAAPSRTAAPATVGEVLFVWSGGERGESHLWLVGTDGGEPRRLINDESLEQAYWPEWSPDGSQIAFRGMSRETYQEDIYVVDADGSDLMQLTDTPDAEQDIAWSPDGAWIAFAGMDSAGFIGVVAADGSTFLRLTDAFEHAGAPAWSPNGTQIAFHGVTGGSSALYIMEDDGANQRRITDETVPGVFQPRWSPDGSRLVFTDGGYDEMFLIDAGGTNLVSLAARGAWGYAPRWSPDGSRIAYRRVAASAEELFVVDANGLNARQVTANGGYSVFHDWSEDGSRLVVASKSTTTDAHGDSPAELRLIDIDGADSRVLLSGDGFMMTPRWRPAGTAVDSVPQPTWPPDLGTPVPTRTPTPPYVPTFDTSGPPWPEPENGICEASPPPTPPGVYLMDADGSNVREVIGPEDFFGWDNVVWSPDGRSVTWIGATPPETIEPNVTPTADAEGNIPGPTHGIFRRDIATGADTMLIVASGVSRLAWSSDGERLAFIQSEYVESTEHHWLAVVNADGTDPRRIAEVPVGRQEVALAFTGADPRVAYALDGDIWLLSLDGSGPVNLTNSLEDEFEPSWSSDGEVLFLRWNGDPPDVERGYPYQLHSVRTDGTDLRVLDQFAPGDRQPNWSPDGSQVAFVRDGEIWLMDADGSDARNMTQHLSPDTVPLWSPDGTQILFRSLYRSPPGAVEELRRQSGQPRPIVLRHAGKQQDGMFMTACWVAGNSRSVGGSGAVAFPIEPMQVDADDAGTTTIQLDFGQLGEPGTVSISVYDLAATRANGKGHGDDAIILPCAAPGGVEESCRVHQQIYQPNTVVDIDLELPPGDYIFIVHSNVVAGTEYGYVEQTFHVRYGHEG